MSSTRFRPDRTTLLAAVVALLGSLPLALSSPWFAPALLLPLGALVWGLRACVVGSPAGVSVSNGGRLRHISWEEVEAFDVPDHGPVVLRTTARRRLRLTALTRRDLPALLATAPVLEAAPVSESAPLGGPEPTA